MVTPVVVDGVMYITGRTSVCARRNHGPPDLVVPHAAHAWLLSEAGGGAIAALRFPETGYSQSRTRASARAGSRHRPQLWDVTWGNKGWLQFDRRSAAIGDLVVSGISGGEEGARGFVMPYRAATGERAGASGPSPLPGEKGSETWSETLSNTVVAPPGSPVPTTRRSGCLYWNHGQSLPDFTAMSAGRQLVHHSVVALDVKTGRHEMVYQFTPHDTHDGDSNGRSSCSTSHGRGVPAS